MKSLLSKLLILTTLLGLVGYFVARKGGEGVVGKVGEVSGRVVEARKGATRLGHEGLAVESSEVKALKLPADEVKLEDQQHKARLQQRRPLKGDEVILAAGGVLDNNPEITDEQKREKRMQSIRAEDWDGQANLLVNELRAAQGFEVKLEEVRDFLLGKDLLGWPEGLRNWIGDEMMTMLRQEVPQQAFEIFKEIQGDVTAPDAMRDYSIQHISHLVEAGHVGQDGVEVIQAALHSGDDDLTSTALVSLHRLSEKTKLVSRDAVKEWSQQQLRGGDERAKLSAAAILKGME